MRSYKVYINQEVLLSAPHCVGDFLERDQAGRTVQVKIIGRFAITFWPDHAVSEVKVTQIKPADK